MYHFSASSSILFLGIPPIAPITQGVSMKFRLPFFLALTCLAIAVPAQASMHPNAILDGLAHFMWHLQMTNQALATGNWPAFWQLFTEQSVCTTTSDFTFLFTPAFFMATVLISLAVALALTWRLLKKPVAGWWNQFRWPSMYHYAQ